MKRPSASPPVISLLTDFGHRDEYVGVMKAVLLSFCPKATIVDLCHAIPPQDVAAAARMLAAAAPYFPENTVNLAVVDPGVGTAREILLLKENNRYYIGPDNGIFTTILQSNHLQECYRIHQSAIGNSISSTFHGRDIMAPAAGKLAAGISLADLGEEIDKGRCVLLRPPFVQLSEKEIVGEIVGIDHFGNITTSIRTEHLSFPPEHVVIEIGGVSIKGIKSAYAEVENQSLLALIDSKGNVEVAKNHGNAAEHLGCTTGDRIHLRLMDSNSLK